MVLEATGGFEMPLNAALAAAGLPMVVANPRQIRDSARAIRRLVLRRAQTCRLFDVCAGQATNGCLVEVEKVTIAQMEEWRKQYPEAARVSGARPLAILEERAGR